MSEHAGPTTKREKATVILKDVLDQINTNDRYLGQKVYNALTDLIVSSDLTEHDQTLLATDRNRLLDTFDDVARLNDRLRRIIGISVHAHPEGGRMTDLIASATPPQGCTRIDIIAEPNTRYWSVIFYEAVFDENGVHWVEIEDHLSTEYAISYTVESLPEVRDLATRWHCYLQQGGIWDVWGTTDQTLTDDGEGATVMDALRAAYEAEYNRVG